MLHSGMICTMKRNSDIGSPCSSPLATVNGAVMRTFTVRAVNQFSNQFDINFKTRSEARVSDCFEIEAPLHSIIYFCKVKLSDIGSGQCVLSVHGVLCQYDVFSNRSAWNRTSLSAGDDLLPHWFESATVDTADDSC